MLKIAIASRVIKLPLFKGTLPTRSLYIYLPPGYEEQIDQSYPVLYMHDGQNVFEAYAQDSFAGVTWRADETADLLITAGEMEPVIIVGVSNGENHRTAEYLPPYITLRMKGKREIFPRPLEGRADRVVAYYQDEVAPFIEETYRTLPGRENRATCGSSMGGLLSNYFAWEFPEFARHHGIISPAYWLTRNQEGGLEMLERMAYQDPPDVRIWLDSGTLDRPGEGDDGMHETAQARDILRDKGFVEGQDFDYHLDEGGIHHESTWAGRLPAIFKFLFPPGGSQVSG